MPIQFNCPQCGKKLSVPDSFAGKKARCPGCSEAVNVPEESQAEAEVSPESRPTIGDRAPIGNMLGKIMPGKVDSLMIGKISFIIGAIIVIGLFLWSSRKASYIASSVGDFIEFQEKMDEETKDLKFGGDKYKEILKKRKEKTKQMADAVQGLLSGSTLSSFFRVLGFLFLGAGLGIVYFKGTDIDKLGTMIVVGLLLAASLGGAAFGL